ncbi:hypothetical protein TRICHSKD4_0546 [Roseibium sp. TrichSKD4]|nr:hypothetical protein TRICHSKD4_2347 [Roseibium sp. TrichSKD4]EFO34057.1 hypothetical protein TRICHSKD4_0546 [Roseibium sp. TrichSKD4]
MEKATPVFRKLLRLARSFKYGRMSSGIDPFSKLNFYERIFP